MKKVNYLVAMVAAGVVASGCANMEDRDRTRVEGTAVGAVLGGALGYAIGDKKGAAIGAALGAGAGFAIGNEIAKRKQAYASTEDFLDGEIARVDEFNQTAVAYNKKMRRSIAQLETEAGQLRRRVASGELKRSELQSKRSAIAKQMESSQKLENSLAQELKVQQQILKEEGKGSSVDTRRISKLTSEVSELQRNLDQLRDNNTQLASIDERLSV